VAATEPSINPTNTSGLPAVRSIKAVRFTALNGDRLAGILAAATMTDTRDYNLRGYHNACFAYNWVSAKTSWYDDWEGDPARSQRVPANWT
jgi:hypothetical protein